MVSTVICTISPSGERTQPYRSNTQADDNGQTHMYQRVHRPRQTVCLNLHRHTHTKINRPNEPVLKLALWSCVYMMMTWTSSVHFLQVKGGSGRGGGGGGGHNSTEQTSYLPRYWIWQGTLQMLSVHCWIWRNRIQSLEWKQSGTVINAFTVTIKRW